MDGPIIYAGNADEPALILGAAGSIVEGKFRLQVRRVNRSSWLSEESIGIKIYAATAADIDIVEASRFTIGVQCMGSGRGFAYNRLTLGSFYDNKIAIDLTNESYQGSFGWCNENLLIGGR